MKTKSLSRRKFLQLGGSALGVGLLAACAPLPAQAPAPVSQASNQEAGEESPPQTETDEEVEQAPAQEQIVIRYGRHDPGLGATTTIEKFMEEHPNIKIEMEQIGEFPTKIPALAAAGTLPDVVRSWEAMVFEMARGGQFIDLQPFIDTEPDFNPEDFYEAVYNYPVRRGSATASTMSSPPT
jgi:ABC-type glycerol-3-phosphate transport system substrate-binding protein